VASQPKKKGFGIGTMFEVYKEHIDIAHGDEASTHQRVIAFSSPDCPFMLKLDR